MPDRPRRRIPGSAEAVTGEVRRSDDATPWSADKTPEQATAEPPRFKRKGESMPPRPASRANSGWGAVDALATADGFVTPLKITDDWLLIKFLEDKPFDVYRQHWFDGIKGQRGWRCLNIDGDTPCLLCDELGDTAQAANSFFNVLAFLGGEDGPTLEVLRAPKGLTKDIKELNEDSRFKGLTDPKLYAELRKKTEGEKRITYQLQPVRARDLKDEWDIEALTEEAIANIAGGQCHSEPISSVREMHEYRALVADLLKQG